MEPVTLSTAADAATSGPTTEPTTTATATATPAPVRDRVARFGPWAGVALALTALLVASPESPAAVTGPALREWIDAQAATIRLFGGSMALSAVLLVAFASDLRVRIRAVAPRSILADLAFGSALLCATWLLVSGGLNSVLGYDTSGYTDEQLVAFYSIGQAGDMIGSASILAKGALMLAVSLAALRGGFLPRWIAWLGIGFGVIALANVLGVLGVAAGGQVLFHAGLFAFALWPLFVGVGLLVRDRRTRRSASDGTPQ